MRYLLLVCLFFSVFSLTAQKYQSAFESLESKDFEKAKKQFDKAKKKLPTLSYYGNGLICAHPDYEDYSMTRAYRYAKYALGAFNRSENQETLNKDYQINAQRLSDFQNEIARQAYHNMRNRDNISTLNQYIAIFTESDIIADVIARRDSLAFLLTEQQGNFRAYQAFAETYPEAAQTPEALKRFESLWKKEYEATLQTGEKIVPEAFERKYPDFPFYDEYEGDHKTIAQRADNLGLAGGYIPDLRPKYDKFIKDAAPKDIAFVALQVMLTPQIEKRNYKAALDTMLQYESYFAKGPSHFSKLKALLEAPEKHTAQPEPLKGKLNTSGWEYSASVTADDKQIVFCGRYREDNLKYGLEDIYYSRKINEEWEAAKPVKELNTLLLNEAPLFISADGTRMILFSEGNIYISDKTALGWGKKRVFPNISLHESWDADAMLTADGNAVIFISDRESPVGPHVPFGKSYHGGKAGNTDIYVSVKENGIWSTPFNIGTTINTPYAERSPFLHPDMKTLYFSSDGHAGFGKKDVFMCKRLNDSSWTEWSEPVNLGKSINTEGDEWGYKISGDGTKAYFSRFDGNIFNIYETILPPEFRPETTTRIFGTIKNTEGEILESEIVWENLGTQKEVGRSNSDPENGSYIITLPNGKNYGFYVETPGYYPISGNIDLSDVEIMQEIEKNFVLISVKKIAQGDKAIPLENIFFEYNSHTLRAESFPELNRLSGFLKKYSELKVEISGHTDNTGSASYNKELSEKRAQSVADYLFKKGIPHDAISVSGYGAEKPVADNDTEQGRAKNRRVEFKVIK